MVDWPLIRQEIGKLSPKLIAPSLLCPVNWYGATRSCHTRCLAPWWRHDIGTLSALLTLCMGNTRKGKIMCGVVGFSLLLACWVSRPLNKQSICRWFKCHFCTFPHAFLEWKHLNLRKKLHWNTLLRDNKSVLVQVIAWCLTVEKKNYLSQYWQDIWRHVASLAHNTLSSGCARSAARPLVKGGQVKLVCPRALNQDWNKCRTVTSAVSCYFVEVS